MNFPFYVNKRVNVRKNIRLENAKIGYQENSQALLEWKWRQMAVNLSGIRFNVSDQYGSEGSANENVVLRQSVA
jgi:hypothetical protein